MFSQGVKIILVLDCRWFPYLTSFFPLSWNNDSEGHCLSTYFLNKFLCLCICLSVYLFMAALGLRCCVWAFSSCGEQGLLFVVVLGLLIAVASLVVEHGL